MMLGIRHGRYYLKMGCKHTARPLSQTVNANSKLSRNLMTVMLWGIRRGCHYLKTWDVRILYDRHHQLQMRTRDFSRNLIKALKRGIRHSRYYPKIGCEHTAWLLSTIVNVNSELSRYLIIVMLPGIRHDRYYLKMGCEHTTRPLSPTANANSKLSRNLINVKSMHISILFFQRYTLFWTDLSLFLLR